MNENPGEQHQRQIAISRVSNLIKNWDDSAAGVMTSEDYNEALYASELDNESLNPPLVPGQVDSHGDLIPINERRRNQQNTIHQNDNVDDESSPSPRLEQRQAGSSLPVPLSSSHSKTAAQWTKQSEYADWPLTKEEITQEQKNLSTREKQQIADRNNTNKNNTRTRTPPFSAATTSTTPRSAKTILDQGRKLQQQELEKAGILRDNRDQKTPVSFLDRKMYSYNHHNNAKNTTAHEERNHLPAAVGVRPHSPDKRTVTATKKNYYGPPPPAFAPSPKIYANSQERDEKEKRFRAAEQQQLLEEKIRQDEERRKEAGEDEPLIDPPPFADDGTSTLHRYVVKDKRSGKILGEGVERIFADEMDNKNNATREKDPPGSVRLYLDENEPNPRMQVSVYSPFKGGPSAEQSRRIAQEKLETRERERRQLHQDRIFENDNNNKNRSNNNSTKKRTASYSSNHLLIGKTRDSLGRLVPKKELEQLEKNPKENKKKQPMPDWLAQQYAKMNGGGGKNKKTSSRSQTPATTASAASSRKSSFSSNNTHEDKNQHRHQRTEELSPEEKTYYRDRLDFEESYSEVSETDREAQAAYQKRQSTKAEFENNLDSAAFKMMTSDQHIAEGNRLRKEAQQEARRLAKLDAGNDPHNYKIDNRDVPMSPNSARLREARLRKHFDEKEQEQRREEEKLRAIAELKMMGSTNYNNNDTGTTYQKQHQQQRSYSSPTSTKNNNNISRIDPASKSHPAGRPTTPKSILQQQQRYQDPQRLFSSDKSVQFSLVNNNDVSSKNEEESNTNNNFSRDNMNSTAVVNNDPHLTLPTSPKDLESIQRRSARRAKMDKPSTSQNVHANSTHNFASSTSSAVPHSRSNGGGGGSTTGGSSSIPENFWSNDVSSVEARNDPELAYGRISWRKQQQNKRNDDNANAADQKNHNNSEDNNDGQVIMTQNVEEDDFENNQVVHMISSLGESAKKNSSSSSSGLKFVSQWKGNREVRSFMGDLMLDESEYDQERRGGNTNNSTRMSTIGGGRNNNTTTRSSNQNGEQIDDDVDYEATDLDSSTKYRQGFLHHSSTNYSSNNKHNNNYNDFSHATLKQRHEEHWEVIPGAQHREQEDIAKMSAATRSAHIHWRDSLRGNTRSQVRGPLADSATKPLLDVDTKMYSSVKPLPIDEHGRVVGAPNIVQKEINNVGKSTGGSGVVISSDSLNHSKAITDHVLLRQQQEESLMKSNQSNNNNNNNNMESLITIEDTEGHTSTAMIAEEYRNGTNNTTTSRPDWNNEKTTLPTNININSNNNPATEEFLQRKKQLWRERAGKKRAEELRLQNELREQEEQKRGPAAAHKKLYYDSKNTASTSLSGTESFAAPLLSGRVKGLRRRPVSAGDKYRVAVAALEKVCEENERRKNLLGGDDDYLLDGEGRKSSKTPKITLTAANSENATSFSRDAKSGVAVATVNSPTANMEQMAEEAKRARREAKNVSFQQRSNSKSGGGDALRRGNSSFGAESSMMMSDSGNDWGMMSTSQSMMAKSESGNGFGPMMAVNVATSRSGSQLTSASGSPTLFSDTATTAFNNNRSSPANNHHHSPSSPKLMKKRNEKLIERQHLAQERANRFARDEPVFGADVKRASDLRHHHSVMSPSKVGKYLPENFKMTNENDSSPKKEATTGLLLQHQQQYYSPGNNASHGRDQDLLRDDDYFVAGRATRRQPTYVDLVPNNTHHENYNSRNSFEGGGSSRGRNSPTVLSSGNSVVNFGDNASMLSARSHNNTHTRPSGTSSSSVVNFLESNNNSPKMMSSSGRSSRNSPSSNTNSGTSSPVLRKVPSTNKTDPQNTTIAQMHRKPNDVVVAKAVTRAVRAANNDDKRILEGKHPENEKPAWMLSATQEDEKAKRDKEKLEGDYFASSAGSNHHQMMRVGQNNNNNNNSQQQQASSSSSAGAPWAAFRNPSKTPPVKKIFGVQHTSNRRRY